MAREAGTDPEWIERWERPIRAERERMLGRALESRLERARLGRSRYPLGESVRRNLQSRSVDPHDVEWSSSRRKDGRWRVSVKFVSRGKRRNASWIFDPEDGEIAATSDLANDVGFVRRR